MRTTAIITALLLAGCASNSHDTAPAGAAGSSNGQSNVDRFYLPQADQPFDGKVETRIGRLEFENQYPTTGSMATILDSMDFHGATQAYLWGIDRKSVV
jgi:hypothetical protein